jgi:hypothetical protein
MIQMRVYKAQPTKTVVLPALKTAIGEEYRPGVPNHDRENVTRAIDEETHLALDLERDFR